MAWRGHLPRPPAEVSGPLLVKVNTRHISSPEMPTLGNLRRFAVSAPQVAWVHMLISLPELTHLIFRRTVLTTLKPITQFTCLRELDVLSTPPNDIRDLTGLVQLFSLVLDGT